MQLEAISSCPIASYLGEETNTCLTTTSFRVVVESNKVPPQRPLFWTKQPQLPQLLLRGHVLQALLQPRCPSLDALQHLNIPVVVRGPKLNIVLKVQPVWARPLFLFSSAVFRSLHLQNNFGLYCMSFHAALPALSAQFDNWPFLLCAKFFFFFCAAVHSFPCWDTSGGEWFKHWFVLHLQILSCLFG